jgi:hypothetical protein
MCAQGEVSGGSIAHSHVYLVVATRNLFPFFYSLFCSFGFKEPEDQFGQEVYYTAFIIEPGALLSVFDM